MSKAIETLQKEIDELITKVTESDMDRLPYKITVEYDLRSKIALLNRLKTLKEDLSDVSNFLVLVNTNINN